MQVLRKAKADRDANKLEQLKDEYEAFSHRHLEEMKALRSLQVDVPLVELHSRFKEEGRMAQNHKHCLPVTQTGVTQVETLVAREQQLVERVSLYIPSYIAPTLKPLRTQ